ncbi:MAG: hypothetical protein BZY80_04765 [SAR202 cluster bacterium Io17-Chloro-G2]|nr:MAG: hypothetical protein BZY80_04765 [SAR202 cluster bacterium Io17-Chloro-G2]
MAFTRRLARFGREGISFDSLDPQVIATSKEMMINAAAVGLAGAAQDQGRALAGLFQDMGGNGRCTIIGMGLRTSPANAALANAFLIHLLDFDDEIQGVATYCTAVIFPAVMALAELNANSGQEILTAFALGCETAAKLDSWVPSSATGEITRPFSGGIAGAVGAAAAAGRLLELDQEQMESALAVAASQAHGPPVNFDPPGRALQCGQAAMAGLTAAMLAQRGFQGARQSIYHQSTLLALSYPSNAGIPGSGQERFFEALANPFSAIYPGLTVKLYPCASASHTAIDAILQLMQQHRIEAGKIESVKVSVTPSVLRSLPYPEPEDPWQARFSLNYIAAQTLLYGQPLIEQFSQSALQDATVRELMGRITITGEETPTPLTDRPATVTVRLVGGRELEQLVEFARGGPQFPLDQEELDAKFLYCARHIMTPHHIQGTIDQFRDLENIQNASGLASILGA